MDPRSISNDATRIYSTCRSVESAGYCDLNFRIGREVAVRCWVFLIEDCVEGVRELLREVPRCGIRGAAPVGIPFRIEGLDEILVEGKEDKEACLCTFALALPPVPVPPADGRYESTDVMARCEDQDRQEVCSQLSADGRDAEHALKAKSHPPWSQNIKGVTRREVVQRKRQWSCEPSDLLPFL